MKKTGRKLWIAFLALLMLLSLHAAAEGEVRVSVDDGTVWLYLKNFTENEQYEYKPVVFWRTESDGEDAWVCFDSNETWQKSLKTDIENDRRRLEGNLLSGDKVAVEIFKRDQSGKSSVDVPLTKSVQIRSEETNNIMIQRADMPESASEELADGTDEVELKFQNMEVPIESTDYRLYIQMEKDHTILSLQMAKVLYGLTYEYDAEMSTLKLGGLNGLFNRKPVIFLRNIYALDECSTSVINTRSLEEVQAELRLEASESETGLQTETASELPGGQVSETEELSEIQTEEALPGETTEITEETAAEETEAFTAEAQEIVTEETDEEGTVTDETASGTEQETDNSGAQPLDGGFVARSLEDFESYFESETEAGSEEQSASVTETESEITEETAAETESGITEESAAETEIGSETGESEKEESEIISSEQEETATEETESETQMESETESKITSEASEETEVISETEESGKAESESNQETDRKSGEKGGIKIETVLLSIAIVLLIICLFILLRMKGGKEKNVSDRAVNEATRSGNRIEDDDSEDTVDPRRTQAREIKSAESKAAVPHKQIRIQASAINNKGRVRTNNEDSFYVNGIFMPRDRMDNGALLTRDFRNNVQLYAVCDGMGGTDSGEDASFCAVRELEKRKDDYQVLAEEEEIKDTLRQISDKVYEEATARGQKSGTTIVMMLVQAEQAIFANVGDSRIYRFRNQKLTQISLDHSKVQRMISMGLMTPEQARKDPGRHVITQYLGMAPDVRISPYIVRDEMQKDDIYVLCSDGLTDMVEDIQIEAILKEKRKLQDTAKTLFETAMKNGGRDNATIVLVHILGGL